MKFDIWSEGFLVTGMEGSPTTAFCLCENVEANSFKEACDKALNKDPDYNSEKLAYWGCRLFDNEEQARESFG